MERNNNSLIILGNGFDLNCLLGTSFSSFFKPILAKINLGLNHYFGISASNCPNIWYLLLYFAFFDQNIYQEGNRLIESISRDNVLWMDVESFIKKIATSTRKNDGWFSKNIAFSYGNNYLELLKNVYSHPFPHIGGIPDQRFLLRSLMRSMKISGELDISAFLYNQLLKFENDFQNYVKSCVSKHIDYKKRAKDILDELTKNDASYYIISFNYTDIFAELHDSRQRDSTNNIHGLMNERIIIGYDSSDVNIESNKVARLSKQWQKMNLGSNEHKLPSKSAVDKIKIYGHSLGPQDYAYFHAIFDYYDIYNSDVQLIFYYTEYGNSEIVNEGIRNRWISNIYDLLNGYTIKSHNEDGIKTILSKLLLENRLFIDKISKQE